MPASTGFTYITASNIYGNLLGQKLATGQIEFQAVSTVSNLPISFEVGGSGQMVKKPYSFPIVNGAIVPDSTGITPQLPDVSLTYPQNIGYLVSIIDPLTGCNILGSGYVIQPTGASFDFDTYEPQLGTMVTIAPGSGDASGLTGVVTEEIPSGTLNGTNPTFTLAHEPNPPSSAKLYLNGLRLLKGTAYTVSGNTITYETTSIPLSGDIHFIDYFY